MSEERDDKAVCSTKDKNVSPFDDCIGEHDSSNGSKTGGKTPGRNFSDEQIEKERSENQPSTHENAVAFKEEGNDFFKNGEHEKALVAYRRGIDCCLGNRSDENTDVNFVRSSAVVDVEVALRSNAGLVLLKLGSYEKAIEECDNAIGLDPSCAKGGRKNVCSAIRFAQCLR